MYANLKLKSLLDVALCARAAIVMQRARILDTVIITTTIITIRENNGDFADLHNRVPNASAWSNLSSSLQFGSIKTTS